MTSFLLLGILLGLRHALEADHLAAVAALATRHRGLGRTVLQGAAWGAGHGVVLLAVGGVCLLFRLAVPAAAARLLEAGIGVLLIVLGWGVLRRVVQRRVHVHLHRHDDGTVHLHAHRHAAEEAHDPEHHRHVHAERLPWRAVGVGMMHGLAGSAALLLLVASTLTSPAVSLLYIACFSAGAVLGMAALSAVISLPLRHTAGLLGSAHNTLETLVGLGALGIGVWVIYAAAGPF